MRPGATEAPRTDSANRASLSPGLEHALLGSTSEDERFDPRARALRRNESRLVALLITDLANAFNATLATAVQRIISEQGYHLVVLHSGTREDECRSLEAVSYERMAGAIVSASYLSPEELMRWSNDCPMVLLADSHVSFSGPLVHYDNFNAARAATAHLAGRGCRRIAHITGPIDTPPGYQRSAGYRRVLEDLGLGPALEVPGDFLVATGRQAMEALLALPEQPDAVFAANDAMAFGALTTLRDHCIEVPEQIAVVGLDNMEGAAWSSPPLTTVDQFAERTGIAAAGLLLSRLQDPRFCEVVEVPHVLVERRSS